MGLDKYLIPGSVRKAAGENLLDFVRYAVERSGRPAQQVLQGLFDFGSRGRVAPSRVPAPRPQVEAPAPVRTSAPAPARAPEQVEQLSLIPQMQEQTKAGLLKYRGRYQSPTGPKGVNVDTVRRSLEPRVQLSSNPLPGDAPAPVRISDPWASQYGQQLELGISPYGASRAIAPRPPEMDPGTLRSIQELSQRASQTYGVPADEIFSQITKPGGVDYLNELASRNALQNIMGRISMKTGVAGQDLSKLLGYAGGAGALSAVGGAAYLMNRPATPDPSLRLTEEQIQGQVITDAPPAPVLPGPQASVVDNGLRDLGYVQPPAAARPPAAAGRPEAPAYRDPVSQTVIVTRGDALTAPDPEKFGDKSIADYYAARKAYSNQAAVKQQLAEFAAREAAGKQAAALKVWAMKNPELAYEMQRRSLADPDQSLQTNQNVQSKALGTELGTNNSNNAQGSAEAVSQSLMAPTEGSYDLLSATRPKSMDVLMTPEQARNYAEGSLQTSETIVDKLLTMAARRQAIG